MPVFHNKQNTTNESGRKTSDSVAALSESRKRMGQHWLMIDDLLGGTESMRLAGERWLPKHESETPEEYVRRIKTSFLYEGLADTLDKHAARPFSRPVTTNDDKALPPMIKEVWHDTDRCGTELDHLAEDLFRDAEKRGLTFVYVDYPPVEETPTRAEEKTRKLRPYLVHVKAENFLGARVEHGPDGNAVITQVRFVEVRTEPDGAYGENQVEYVRVINAARGSEKGTWELWRISDETGETGRPLYKAVMSGVHTYPGPSVPFVPIYFKKVGDLEARSPMKKLAEVNVMHWQSSSDHRNLLRFSRVDILFGSGFSGEQVEQGITISPYHAALTKNPDADLKYVSYDASIIEAGEKDLQALERRMEVLGLQPLMERVENVTATGVFANESKSMTLIQLWISHLECGLTEVFKCVLRWVGDDPDKVEDLGISIYKDFFISGDPNENEFLLNATVLNKIPDEVFIHEMYRRNVLDPSKSVDQIMTMLQKQREQSMMTMQEEEEARARARKLTARSGPGPQSAE